MFIAKVVGNIWATRKHPALEGAKLLLIKPYDPESKKTTGQPILALDKYLGAGIGDMVLIIDEGNSARQILNNADAPVRTVVIGVLDSVSLHGNHYRYH